MKINLFKNLGLMAVAALNLSSVGQADGTPTTKLPENFFCWLTPTNDEQRDLHEHNQDSLAYLVYRLYVDGDRLIVSTQNEDYRLTPEKDVVLDGSSFDGRTISEGFSRGGWDAGEFWYKLSSSEANPTVWTGTFTLEQDFPFQVTCRENKENDVTALSIFSVGEKYKSLVDALYDLNVEGRYVRDVLGVTGVELYESNRGALGHKGMLQAVAKASENNSIPGELLPLGPAMKAKGVSFDDLIAGETGATGFPYEFRFQDEAMDKALDQVQFSLNTLLGSWESFEIETGIMQNVDSYTSVFVSPTGDQAVVIYWNIGA